MEKLTEKALAIIRKEHDEMFARMQTPAQRRALEAAFRATPKEMGEAAVRAALKNKTRGRK
ncbi:MAG: hypothetical protein ABIP81_05240 [Terriglobales bacterium]